MKQSIHQYFHLHHAVHPFIHPCISAFACSFDRKSFIHPMLCVCACVSFTAQNSLHHHQVKNICVASLLSIFSSCHHLAPVFSFSFSFSMMCFFFWWHWICQLSFFSSSPSLHRLIFRETQMQCWRRCLYRREQRWLCLPSSSSLCLQSKPS